MVAFSPKNTINLLSVKGAQLLSTDIFAAETTGTGSQAESDASSEMSDDALHNLVSRLVDAGGDIGEDDEDGDYHEVHHTGTISTSAAIVEGTRCTSQSHDAELLGAATGQAMWSSSTDQPSPIRGPRASGQLQARLLGIEAAVLDSAEASDASSGGGGYAEPSPALAASTLAASTAGEAEADSCGYEGDVGESAKFIPSVRRPASVVVVAPPGAPAKATGGEEADDERPGKATAKPHVPQQPTSLDISGRGNAYFTRCGSLGRMSGVAEESPWDTLNETIREQGFRPVSLSRPGGAIAVPDPASLMDTLRDVVFQHGERGKTIQEMSLELSKQNQVTGHREQVQNESFRRQKSDLSRRCVGAEARVAVLERESGRLKAQLAKQTRQFKTENANLMSQLKQSEHRVKAKEAAAQGLMDKLRDEAEKERLAQQKERAVLLKFQQKSEVRGGAANDSRLAESIIAHSKAQERSEAEADFLRAEVSRLGDELREKENTILRHRLGPDWTPALDQSTKACIPACDPHTSDELQHLRDRLAESERSVRVMRLREARALERFTDMEKGCADANAKAEQTQDSLVNAQLELSSRPSLRNWRASQRRIADLETKLAQATTQAKEAVDVAELRRWVDTRELMRRDRGNHRLKLDKLDELPSAVMKQVLQDACRLLALQDVSLLGPSVAKLTKVVQMLPRLERFVNSVCVFVFRHSSEVLSAPSDGSLSQLLDGRAQTMEDVLPLLELWLARAQEPVQLKEFHNGVLRLLDKRTGLSSGARGAFGKSDRAVLSAIQHLVALERTSLEGVHLNEQADWSLNDDPEQPVNRVVRHFQLLFGVKSIGGCTAKLNEVYRFTSEMHTFLRTAADLLDMPNAKAEAVMKQLEAVLEERVGVDPDACLRVSHDAGSWTAGRQMEERPAEV
eukprot:jgi/Undpi1/5455/HiC_scaffold_2.g00734.m1